jgi:hypothetical protein
MEVKLVSRTKDGDARRVVFKNEANGRVLATVSVGREEKPRETLYFDVTELLATATALDVASKKSPMSLA